MVSDNIDWGTIPWADKSYPKLTYKHGTTKSNGTISLGETGTWLVFAAQYGTSTGTESYINGRIKGLVDFRSTNSVPGTGWQSAFTADIVENTSSFTIQDFRQNATNIYWLAVRIGWFCGAKTVTLTVEQMPRHKHYLIYHDHDGNVDAGKGIPFIGNGNEYIGTDNAGVCGAGGGQPHNNLQPYIVVNFWKRTA